MKLLTGLAIAIALAAPLQAQDPKSPIPEGAELQAKLELNEAALAYREGKFAEAQAHSEKALLLDPKNKTALYFVARTIHAQYKPGDSTTDNLAKAREAIIAYQRILNNVPGDDESFKAVAFLYGELKEEELFRQWVLQRAADVSIANDKRAEAFVALASKDWDCAFKITELPANKFVVVDGKKSIVSYRMPKDRAEFERAKECANRGMEMVNIAITLTPESESAWSYKTNIFLELAKLAEMSGDMQRRRELQQQYEEALKETTKLSKQSQANP